jgi:hypothetical protein
VRHGGIILFSPHNWRYPPGPYPADFQAATTVDRRGALLVDLRVFCAFSVATARGI